MNELIELSSSTASEPIWAVENLHVIGTAADDTLYGGKGRDRIDGGGGTDTASYNDVQRNYRVEYDASTDTYTVTHLERNGRDVDTLSGIEQLRFTDVEAPIAAFTDDAPTPLRPVRFAATEGADSLAGREYGELISGLGGNDLLQGNGGADKLYGGKGEDTAVYAGNFANYELVFDQFEWAYRVTDRVTGRDGSDLLWGMEKLRFADLTVLLTSDHGARIEGGAEVLPAWAPPPYQPPSYDDVVLTPGIDGGIVTWDGWMGTTSAGLVTGKPELVGVTGGPATLGFDA